MRTSVARDFSVAALAAGLMAVLASAPAACSSSSGGGSPDGGEDDAAAGDAMTSDGTGGGGGEGGEDASSDQGSQNGGDTGLSSDGRGDSPAPVDASGDTGHDTGAACDGSPSCFSDMCCPFPSQACGTYTLTGDTVVDSSTGLTWERSFAGLTDYPTAMNDCSAWGGRLPTQAELTAYIQARASCTSQVRWNIPSSSEPVWTSTAYSGGGAHYCVFYGPSGSPMAAPDGDSHLVQCVK